MNLVRQNIKKPMFISSFILVTENGNGSSLSSNATSTFVSIAIDR
jgi:hypothetical protein